MYSSSIQYINRNVFAWLSIKTLKHKDQNMAYSLEQKYAIEVDNIVSKLSRGY